MNARLLILVAVFVALGGVALFRYIGGGEDAGNAVAVEMDTPLKCAREDCGQEFTRKLSRLFESFPVDCEKCGQKNAWLVVVCPGCQTRHANVAGRESVAKCSKCGVELPPE